MPFENPSSAGKAGLARMREIAAQNQAEIAGLTDGLIKSLEWERPVTVAEEILAEQIAVAIVRGRRKRDLGRNDSAERAELERLVTGSPWDAKVAAPETATA